MGFLVLYKIIFLITAFGAGVIAIDIFLKKKSERPAFDLYFGIMSLAFVAWAGGRLGLLVAESKEQALFWAHFLYIGSICVHVLFLHVILIFVGKEKTAFGKTLLTTFYTLGAVLVFFNLLYFINGNNYLISDVVSKLDFKYYEVPDRLYFLHLVNYLFIPAYACFELARAFLRRSGSERKQVAWVIFSSFLGFFGGNSVVPLVYEIQIQPVLLILVPFYLLTMTYAITRYKLFNTKVVTTELFTFTLWVLILIRVFFSQDSTEQIFNLSLLVLTIIVGVLLIRSVVKEVEQREYIERLAEDLEKSNKSLGAANERLKELDQLKSEFVSMATHQIRGPLTAMKGYASMILQGDFGTVPDTVRSPVETILESSNSLTGVVQDFLDISRIEQGRMKYDFSIFDLSKLAYDVANELTPNIERKGLLLKLEIEAGIVVRADIGKMKQVIENLLDNAQKYTPKDGHIIIRLTRSADTAVLSVKDTGVGIKPETLPKLFQKFSRAEDASKANILGTGLGLYVAKELITAQGGTIRAESEGEGKGSTFSVELPLKT